MAETIEAAEVVKLLRHLVDLNEDVRHELRRVSQRQRKQRRELQQLRGEVQELRGEVQELRGEVQELRGGLQELRGDFQAFVKLSNQRHAQLCAELQEVRGEVQELRGRLHELEGEVQELRRGLQELRGEFQAFAKASNQRHEYIMGQLTLINHRLTALETHAVHVDERFEQLTRSSSGPH